MDLKRYKLGEIVKLHTITISPNSGTIYKLYSLPSFDNGMQCEIVDGNYIQSNKFSVPNKCILFNKLNVRFKRVWRINNEDTNKLCSTEFLPLIVDENIVDYQYLYYLLISDGITNYLCGQNTNTSGSHKRIDPNDFLNINVFLPSKSAQKQIGKLLSYIDNKINLNHALNQNLEAMAKQLYDYWFVQFDFPDENGRPYKSSGGKMVWNNKLKREIPEGWKVSMLANEVDLQYGFPFSTELFTEQETTVPVVRIRDILNNTISTYTTEEVEEKYLLKKQDLLVGMDGNFHMNYWTDNKSYLNQRSVRLRASKNSNVSIVQVKYDIQPYIKAKEARAKGSTVGHLSDKDMKELYVLVCTDKKAKGKFDSILSMIITNRNEIELLTKQRDELLPLLMNGQVSVNSDL